METNQVIQTKIKNKLGGGKQLKRVIKRQIHSNGPSVTAEHSSLHELRLWFNTSKRGKLEKRVRKLSQNSLPTKTCYK